MTEMRATREALDHGGYTILHGGRRFPDRDSALAEVEAMEAVATAARAYLGAEYDQVAAAYYALINALRRLDALGEQT